MTSDEPAAPRDERAILDELERLHDAIQSTRRQRQQKAEEFDAFVNTFRGPRTAERLAEVEAMEAAASGRAMPPGEAAAPPPVVQPFPLPPSRTRSVLEDADAPARSSGPRLAPLPSDAVLRELRQKIDTDDTQEVMEELQRRVAASEPSTSTPRRQTKLPPRVIAIAGAIALAIVLVMLWRPWQRSPSAGARTPASPASPGQRGAATSAAPDTTAPLLPPSRRAVALELTAARAVWMRVVVDGKNVVEREVGAGEVLNFGADQTVVVRAGDAGNVRVKLNGADLGPLGKEGFPITRTFGPDAGRD